MIKLLKKVLLFQAPPVPLLTKMLFSLFIRRHTMWVESTALRAKTFLYSFAELQSNLLICHHINVDATRLVNSLPLMFVV